MFDQISNQISNQIFIKLRPIFSTKFVLQLLRHLPYKTHVFANLVEWKPVFEGRRPVIESQFGRQSGGQSWGPKWGPKWGAKQPEWGPSDAADLINIVTLPHRHPVIQPARQPATHNESARHAILPTQANQTASNPSSQPIAQQAQTSQANQPCPGHATSDIASQSA